MSTASELEIETLLCGHLFEEFIYRSPATSMGRELADVLVALDDTLIILQAKMPGFTNQRRSAKKLERWTTKNREDAYRQIGRTWTYIVNGQAAPLVNRRLPPRQLNAKDLRNVIGLAIVGDEEVDLAPRTTVRKAATTIPVLTLTLPQFRHIVRAFDTVGDFVLAVVHMAEEAERVQSTTGRPALVIECLVALLTYFDPALTEGERDRLLQDPGRTRAIWSAFTMVGGAIDARRKLFGASYFIDDMLSRMHECQAQYASVRNARADRETLPKSSQWPVLIQEVARLTRRVRQEVGAAFLSILKVAESSGRATYRLFWLDGGQHFMVLFAGEGDREQRRRALEEITYAAWIVHRPAEILGIATDPGLDGARSFQFVYRTGEAPRVVPAGFERLVNEIESLRTKTGNLQSGPR